MDTYPVVSPVMLRDLDGFEKPYAQFERRQPAEFSWWIGPERRGFTALAWSEYPRMRTSPFSRIISKVLD